MKRFTMLCYTTFQCNYRCPYCEISLKELWRFFRFIEGHYWLDFFKKIPPSLLSFTGGEPFLYPDFLFLMEELPKRHLVLITSNLSMPIEQFLDVAPVEQIIAFMGSLHPLQKNFSMRKFLTRIKMLQEYGILVWVNYVAYPAQIEIIPKIKHLIEGEGIFFNVDPFISKTYNYTEEEKGQVSKFVMQKRKVGYSWEEEGFRKLCSAGRDYICTIPTGDAYRCNSGFFLHDRALFHIGNIKQSLKLNSRPKECFNSCPAACDLSYVTTYDSSGKILSNHPFFWNEIIIQILQKFRHNSLFKELLKVSAKSSVYSSIIKLIVGS